MEKSKEKSIKKHVQKYWKKSNTKGYCIEINGKICEGDLIEILDMSIEKFVEILLEYNAYQAKFAALHEDYYFKKLKDIRACLRALEPYLVMATLMK